MKEALLTAAKEYAHNNDLAGLDVDGLDQCQQSMDEIAQEILWFGFDTWPDLGGNVVELATSGKPHRPPMSALAACVIGALVVSTGCPKERHEMGIDFRTHQEQIL